MEKVGIKEGTQFATLTDILSQKLGRIKPLKNIKFSKD